MSSFKEMIFEDLGEIEYYFMSYDSNGMKFITTDSAVYIQWNHSHDRQYAIQSVNSWKEENKLYLLTRPRK
ncbi:hypothetical protein Klosneuvirus_1_234 [Klosneuvirus KNV1]|uniref:Uncharacterized protein n=1 Tax=Klosneuvirus KNV1 TaxID=1977640 RepID=A0A1V0SI34_9VIRU|nr:hypothetical protein Klosneuvirus_1_234 [Klosneuvirus KNV1]